MIDIEDHPALLEWLHTWSLIDGANARCENLTGGVSNKTVLVSTRDQSVVVKQALHELRVATTWECSPDRIHREGLGLRVLKEILPPGCTPNWLAEDKTQHILVMSAIPAPHDNWKSLLLQGRVTSGHIEQFATLLAMIHTAEITPKMQPFRDTSFFEALRLTPYYEYTGTQVVGAAPFLNALAADTLSQSSQLVHGDYSPKNILVNNGRLILLDHEVMHIGDPAFDVGFALAHLLSKAHHLASHREDFVHAAHGFWSRYRELTDCGPERATRAGRHTLACLLARVAGRSPLEYLNKEKQQRQREICLGLMNASDTQPMDIRRVIDHFSTGIEDTP